MIVFQILLLLLAGSLLCLTLVALVRGWATRREAFVSSAVCVVVAVAVAWPEVTVRLARLVGIGRGADLVLYLFVVAMLVGFSVIYARIRRLRREITLLVRHLAIRDATILQPPAGVADDQRDA